MKIDWTEEVILGITVRDALTLLEYLPKTSSLYWTAKAILEDSQHEDAE